MIKKVSRFIWKVVSFPFRVVFRGVRGVVRFVLALPRNLWRGIRAVARLTWQGIRTLVRWLLAPPKMLWRGIVAAARAIRRSPRAAYESTRRARDFVLNKINFLQQESDKWRALFTALKLPYTALLKLGFNPQSAVALLFAGTAVTSGVVAAEVMAPPSFAAGDAGIYSAPLDVPVFFEEQYNTLRLDLGTTSIGNITIEDVSLG